MQKREIKNKVKNFNQLQLEKQEKIVEKLKHGTKKQSKKKKPITKTKSNIMIHKI